MGVFDIAFLVAALTIAAPILLAATGELISQRAGVMNVGLEGVLLAGAFAGYLTMTRVDSQPLGFLGGIAGGLLLAALMAVLAIEVKVDQIVAGIAIGVLGLGLTTFFDQHFVPEPQTFTPLPRLAVPLLSDLPVVGEVLFHQDLFIYATIVVVVLVGLAMYRTTWGINLAATGESPVAADAAGVSIRGVRWAAVLVSGACAGAAGAYISIGDVGVFREDMTGGRGYLAIAAVLFGAWRLRGLLLAVAIFAVTDAIQLRLQSIASVPGEVWAAAALLVLGALVAARHRQPRRAPKPAELIGAVLLAGLVALAVVRPQLSLPASLWLAMPYVLALVALAAGGAARHRAPSGLTLPYIRSEA
ncbi:ABC transporter permease [Actinoplanes bogorensis]|uniref:ABC transporter permease n=1 Tax=Paractinoplanes bogorensis TaxID=1610840 RepID=A0ABS5YWW0_9ACTN|nr:ABC transporter permease [Actinoplanes bogorensis]MBU2667218.1 ABC transporter permease [Actinoplanes bogorensis]